MRIVSPFHDYYDAGMRHAQGEGALFLRKTETLSAEGGNRTLFEAYQFMFEGFPSVKNFYSQKSGSWSLRPFRLAFCGKVFSGVEAHIMPVHDSDRRVYCYTNEALNRVALEVQVPGPKMKREAGLDVGFFGKAYKRFLEGPINDQKEQLFSVAGEAIMLSRISQPFSKRVITRNPILREIEFFKVRDVWQAYQELEMFFDGRAAPENKNIAVIEDKYRITQHGFDKHSFRKMPTKQR